jgi:hypothetical protein
MLLKSLTTTMTYRTNHLLRRRLFAPGSTTVRAPGWVGGSSGDDACAVGYWCPNMHPVRPTAALLSLAQLAMAQVDWHLTRIPSAHTADLAHDARRGTSVLFDDGETWELDRAWLRRDPPTSPPPRSQHALAYDPGRGVITLFGGTDQAGQLFQDTWDWDGSTWHLRATSGPAPRSDTALAWDPVTSRLLLFGGAGTGLLPDTWHFDGVAWTQLLPANAPPGRYGHSLATDVGRRRIVLFGGLAAATLNDTWEWTAATVPGRVSPRPRPGPDTGCVSTNCSSGCGWWRHRHHRQLATPPAIPEVGRPADADPDHRPGSARAAISLTPDGLPCSSAAAAIAPTATPGRCAATRGRASSIVARAHR